MIRSVIAFGVRAVGCLYVSYWALFFRNRGLPSHHFLPAGTQASSSGKNRLTSAPLRAHKIAKAWKGDE
jgi:hypothetical protein